MKSIARSRAAHCGFTLMELVVTLALPNGVYGLIANRGKEKGQ